MFDPDWARLSLDDAPMPYDELDRRCSLSERWPDWRLLCQPFMWLTPDDDFVALEDLDGPALADLLLHLRSNAPALHAQAATDEQYATSSAMRWAYEQLGVLPVADLHPLAWLDTTPLVRALRQRIATELGGAA